nr:FAD-dependent oxidoreductase [Gemmatimonadota bacterium]NIQ57904.1 FAD-dependent oxidoreductase [Gemmatimonadota bacterium]NIU78073.1 FAD-dependent oxidoreductase [Gammaproteobacteria bacterium]NIY11483.1 FAD-dependent oxidoreductase [Gemmatimonadota bacterium]
MKRVVIVGGGVTGLTTALNLRERAAAAGTPIQVTVLEAGPRPGGNIRTDRVDGFTIEKGPNGFLDNAPGT